MKRKMELFVALFSCLAAACGGGKKVEDQDAASNQNTNQNLNLNVNQNQPDAAVQPDGSVGDCDHTGFTFTSELASTKSYGLAYQAYSSEAEPVDLLMVQIYTEWNGPTTPGTYSLDNINYADCGLCLLVYAGCTTTECEKTFYADAGSVLISSIGGLGSTFAATFQNVVFKEVTIDSGTWVSTPVPGGDTWCMNGYGFSQTVQDENAATCGQAGVNCVGETIPDFALQNCETGDFVDVYDMAAGAKALWFVGSHVWCSACASYLPQVIQDYDTRHASGLNLAIVVGDDSGGNQIDLTECRAYAASYDSDASLFYIDHNGQSSHAVLFDNLYPYPSQDMTLSFPWNAVMNAQTYE
ncbi:MAG: hypothetical protein RBU30_18130, partial [Polyangia bacterium]|nr:hypothetical protein [Polyangia bacterium]